MKKEEIREFRFSLGFSQEKMAFFLGVSAKTVSRWERGRNSPSSLAMEKLKALKEKNGG